MQGVSLLVCTVLERYTSSALCDTRCVGFISHFSCAMLFRNARSVHVAGGHKRKKAEDGRPMKKKQLGCVQGFGYILFDAARNMVYRIFWSVHFCSAPDQKSASAKQKSLRPGAMSVHRNAACIPW